MWMMDDNCAKDYNQYSIIQFCAKDYCAIL